MKTKYLLYKIWRQEHHKTKLPDWELRLVFAAEDTQVHIGSTSYIPYGQLDTFVIRLETVYSLNEVKCYRPLNTYKKIKMNTKDIRYKFVKKCNNSKSALLFIEKRSR